MLVVDDNVDSAEMLRQFLIMSEHEVRMAHNGPDAVTQAEDFKPHVVLLDIGLPGLTGHEVAQRIRMSAGGEGVMLIALTGWGQPADRQRSAEAGFDLHLVKPIDLFEISDLIASAPKRSTA